MTSSDDFQTMFDLAPVSLWLEDYSGLKQLFDRWRAEGVTDLAAHLQADPARRAACMASIQVLRVNQKTLSLFGAADQDELVARLPEIFRDDMADRVIGELAQFWAGHTEIQNETVNYALDGRRLDVNVRIRILPGHEHDWSRALVSLDDITARVRAERMREASERYARGLFERSPVSLWVEDFSGVKRLLDGVRAQGIRDFGTFLKVHPEFVGRCIQEIRVLDVNEETLRMFGAPDKPTLLRSLSRVFRGEMHDSFAEQLRDLWDGKTTQQREVVNYTLGGEAVHIYMQFSVLADRQDNWDLVLLSLVDITARRRAEAYLEYLGTHDVLTQLRNRTFYTEEIARLSRKGPWPLSILTLDMNGLKQVNDQVGHAAGDALLRRAGEVLAKLVDAPSCVARVGGDEFIVLMPDTDERGVRSVREHLHTLVDLNNQFYAGPSGHLLSFAMGAATCRQGESVDAALQAADRAMYEDKARHYEAEGVGPRRVN